jgi:serine-type D-Ala-D-Ala carboxypeptidase
MLVTKPRSEAAFAPLDAFIQQAIPLVCPAAVVLVYWRGETIFHRAYGFIDPDIRQLPATTQTIFDLASLTKLFTATAFMRLVEAGKTSLDLPVGEVIPEMRGERRIGPSEDPLLKVPLLPEARHAGKTIPLSEFTFRRILTHTAGLAAWRSIYQVSKETGEIPLPHLLPPALRSQRIAAVTNYDFYYPPGEHIVYSDLGFILLGEAVTRLSGMGLESFLDQALFQPMGLAHTGYNPLAADIPAHHIAPTEECAWRGRRLAGEVDDENAASLGGISGHAGLFSTAAEVALLGQLYLRQGMWKEERLLSSETVAAMTAEQVALDGLRRGLAWLLWTPQNCTCGQAFGTGSFGHTGFTGTSLWVDPQRDLLVVALTNRVYHGRDPAAIGRFRPRLHDLAVNAVQALE